MVMVRVGGRQSHLGPTLGSVCVCVCVCVGAEKINVVFPPPPLILATCSCKSVHHVGQLNCTISGLATRCHKNFENAVLMIIH